MNTEAGGFARRIRCSWIPDQVRDDASAGLVARLETLAEAERDQLPLWLPVGLVLGIGAWFWLPDADAWTAFLLLAAALALGQPRRSRRARAGAGRSPSSASPPLLGCGLIWWKAERAAAPRLRARAG